MLRPGLNQVPRTTLRHYPLAAALCTAAVLTLAVLAFHLPPAHALAPPAWHAVHDTPAMITLTTDGDAIKTRALLLADTATITVRAGDTLSVIASRALGHASAWPALWWANHRKLRNPAALVVGEILKIPVDSHTTSWMDHAALAAIPKPAPVKAAQTGAAGPASSSPPAAPAIAGIYSYAQLESLWESVGGPASAAPQAAQIAECESGGNPSAYNPSGATGLWQILGSVVAGDLTNPIVNAENAVAKFNASGGTFAQWICQ